LKKSSCRPKKSGDIFLRREVVLGRARSKGQKDHETVKSVFLAYQSDDLVVGYCVLAYHELGKCCKIATLGNVREHADPTIWFKSVRLAYAAGSNEPETLNGTKWKHAYPKLWA
jgi:hypothetical protein